MFKYKPGDIVEFTETCGHLPIGTQARVKEVTSFSADDSTPYLVRILSTPTELTEKVNQTWVGDHLVKLVQEGMPKLAWQLIMHQKDEDGRVTPVQIPLEVATDDPKKVISFGIQIAREQFNCKPHQLIFQCQPYPTEEELSHDS